MKAGGDKGGNKKRWDHKNVEGLADADRFYRPCQPIPGFDRVPHHFSILVSLDTSGNGMLCGHIG